MPEAAVSQVDQALQALHALAASRRPKAGAGRRPGARLQRWLFQAGLLGVALVLPFLLLVRTAVFLYQVHLLPVWLAVALGAAGTTALLGGYASLLSRALRGRWRPAAWVLKGLFVLVLVYCGYALLYVSAANVKQPALRSTYTVLHPLLRLSVSTLILADAELVITDAERQPEDYRRMGLPVRARSLHYRQADGYAHAADLRTAGRAAWKNALVKAYFQWMGFDTLRHVGTADHLHVTLPSRRVTP